MATTSTAIAWVVEVNEGVVEASRQGVEWWHLFVARFRGTGRLRYTKQPCVVGGVVEVACEDRVHAERLADQMVGAYGLPKSAVRVKRATAGAV